ncbi:hypothetical protein JOM56_003585 [Amanita muscaria]|uniref:Uncharacterized protein n=1 Tax=Amanita muscaria (strain Koide BX008) TaxID=946122 RepID=A0A0C2TQZ8_AMAMK|nr:hypothetical protein M378DRAFT_7523 [Amanita muscaria Koide BX008]
MSSNETRSSNPMQPATDDAARARRTSHHHRHEDIDREAKRNQRATAGVVEARPGIIESSNIDPLHHDPSKEEVSK